MTMYEQTTSPMPSVGDALSLGLSPRPSSDLRESGPTFSVWMLADMEGWDFHHEQKKAPALRHIPVIGVSAIGKLVDVEYSFRKPLDYDECLAAVQHYVASPARPVHR